MKKPVPYATRPLMKLKKKNPSGWPIVVGAALALTAVAGGGFFMIKRNNAANTALSMPPDSEAIATPEVLIIDPVITAQPLSTESLAPLNVPAVAADRPGGRSADQVNREAAELLASQQQVEKARATRRLEVQNGGNLFEVGDRELLLENKGAEVQLAGRLAEVRFSGDGKGPTLYLEFSKPAAKDEPRGYIMRRDLTDETSLESLQKFIGKKVSLRGKVNTPSFQGRPEIEIKNLAAIQEVK